MSKRILIRRTSLIAVLFVASLFVACAPTTRTAGLVTDPSVDAVLPVGETWRLFRLASLRHTAVPASPDSWKDGMPAQPEWLTLAAPAGPFRPVQVVPAQRGYFYLVDAASARLCLYDADAALLSTFPLPDDFTPFAQGRMAIFRGADGAFTFVDYNAGEALQFADRLTTGSGPAHWIPRGRVKLPAGLRECAQAPGSVDLLCRGNEGSPLRFDGALNRIGLRGSGREQALRSQPVDQALLRVEWDTVLSQWVIEGIRATSNTADSQYTQHTLLFRYVPARKHLALLSPLPHSGTEPSAPASVP